MPEGISGGVDGRIKVSFAGLSQGSADIARSAQLIDQELQDLKTKIGKLVSGWTGSAAEEYQQHQRKWDTAAADLQRVLASIGTAVGQAGQDYSDGERQNASRWT
ncbi:MAG: WXG100 family type VII secretion target [Pseudonocardiaceae bacterium]|nr:WXG100 family type VII secretion target [Pseudonocardiaceae bacterium]